MRDAASDGIIDEPFPPRPAWRLHQVIDHLIRAKIKDGGAELDNPTDLAKHIFKRMPLHNQARLESLYNSWVVYWRVPYRQLVQQQEQHRSLKGQQRSREHEPKRPISPRFRLAGQKATPPRASVIGGIAVGNKGQQGGHHQRGVEVVEDEDFPTTGEMLRERAGQLWEAVMAAVRFAVVVLRGSMWQPLVSRGKAATLGCKRMVVATVKDSRGARLVLLVTRRLIRMLGVGSLYVLPASGR